MCDKLMADINIVSLPKLYKVEKKVFISAKEDGYHLLQRKECVQVSIAIPTSLQGTILSLSDKIKNKTTFWNYGSPPSSFLQ